MFLALVVTASLGTLGCFRVEPEVGASAPIAPHSAPPTRIVSLAPSVTEVLFAVGLGDRVVGVTRYCDFPPEVSDLPKIGGYLDLSYEAIVALEPDLAIGIQDHDEACARLERLGVPTLQVDQHDVAGILDSIARIAEVCGADERGRALAGEIQDRIDAVAAATAGLDRPRALVVVDRKTAGGRLTTVWAAGPATFYHEIVALAGGRNAVESGITVYPELSIEGLLAVDPDVIIEVAAELDGRGTDVAAFRADWSRLGVVRAVREGQVSVLDQDWMVIPGPRVAEVVERFARALHPGMEAAGDG